MPRHLLLVAFHYPPLQGSTGIARALSIVRHLPAHGWRVTVLSAHPRAYTNVEAENLALIPPDADVVRAFALDTRKHLALRGRYPLFLAVPDRWQSWILGALLSASRIFRRERPDVIMSTYPIASAHVIGLVLARRYGVPWLADFRDPMAQVGYPPEALLHRSYKRIEVATFKFASRITVTTAGSAMMYANRYPACTNGPPLIVPNGYDEELFAQTLGIRRYSRRRSNGPLVLLHSGLLYPKERNPEAFFSALAQLYGSGSLDPGKVQFHFRGCGHEAIFAPCIQELGLEPIVRLLPTVPYRDALQEMRDADAYLIFQASNCNQQIPAKIYEYLYCGKPILALTDSSGDTGQLLQNLGSPYVAPLDNPAAIAESLMNFIRRLEDGSAFTVPEAKVQAFSRRQSVALLADHLEQIATPN